MVNQMYPPELQLNLANASDSDCIITLDMIVSVYSHCLSFTFFQILKPLFWILGFEGGYFIFYLVHFYILFGSDRDNSCALLTCYFSDNISVWIPCGIEQLLFH